MEFLYLNEDEMIEVGVKNMRRCMDTMEDMFRLLKAGDYRMGGENGHSHGVRIKFPKSSPFEGMPIAAPDRWFTSMPAYLGGNFKMVGVKTYGSNHENAKKDLPRSILMLSLLDKETGAPLAYMSANILSAMRTGAVAGLGAKYLAPSDAKVLTVIGPGVMSRYSTDAIIIGCPSIKEIRIKGRGKKNIEKFVQHCKENYPQVKDYVICDTVDEACIGADVIFTGNTRANTFEENPLLDENTLHRGALVITSSAFRIHEEFLHNTDMCVCVADDRRIYQEDYGVDAMPLQDEEKRSITFNVFLHEMAAKSEKVLDLTDIITDDNFQKDESKIYVYGAYGMPVEDVAWGKVCYEEALKLNVGTRLKLWDSPKL